MNKSLYLRRQTFRESQILRVARLVKQHKPVESARDVLESVTHRMLRMEVSDANQKACKDWRL